MNIRLALRKEGNFWNAYLALPNTMKGAKLIGSIAIGPIVRDPELKETFRLLMQRIVSDAILATTGEVPSDWEVREGPESERAGHS